MVHRQLPHDFYYIASTTSDDKSELSLWCKPVSAISFVNVIAVLMSLTGAGCKACPLQTDVPHCQYFYFSCSFSCFLQCLHSSNNSPDMLNVYHVGLALWLEDRFPASKLCKLTYRIYKSPRNYPYYCCNWSSWSQVCCFQVICAPHTHTCLFPNLVHHCFWIYM